MESELPKVLVEVCGRPMVEHVLSALAAAKVDRTIVVVGYRAGLVRTTLADWPGICFVEQTEQLGTGHAVMVCRDALSEEKTAEAGPVLVITGDSPLVQASSVRRLFEQIERDRPACILGTARKDPPGGLGRIVRDTEGNFLKIIEVKDATPEQQKITEVNMSTYVFDRDELLHAMGKLTNQNAQHEYYITDCPGILRDEGKTVLALDVLQPCESMSINNRAELAEAEAVMRQMQ